MLKVVLYTLLIFGAYYGIKAGVNVLAARYTIFSKFGALRFMLNPMTALSRAFGIIWKIVKYGAMVILVMTIVAVMLR